MSLTSEVVVPVPASQMTYEGLAQYALTVLDALHAANAKLRAIARWAESSGKRRQK